MTLQQFIELMAAFQAMGGFDSDIYGAALAAAKLDLDIAEGV